MRVGRDPYILLLLMQYELLLFPAECVGFEDDCHWYIQQTLPIKTVKITNEYCNKFHQFIGSKWDTGKSSIGYLHMQKIGLNKQVMKY